MCWPLTVILCLIGMSRGPQGDRPVGRIYWYAYGCYLVEATFTFMGLGVGLLEHRERSRWVAILGFGLALSAFLGVFAAMGWGFWRAAGLREDDPEARLASLERIGRVMWYALMAAPFAGWAGLFLEQPSAVLKSLGIR